MLAALQLLVASPKSGARLDLLVKVMSACAGMRGVDLSCLLLSPIAAGFLMTYAGMRSAILVIALWNLASWVPECYLLYIAQQASSALR